MDRHRRLARSFRRNAAVTVFAVLAALTTDAAHAQGTPYLVRDVEPRPNASAVAVLSIGAVGDRVFFAGNDGVHGFELWASDGSEAGTRLVKDIRPGLPGAAAGDFTAVGDGVFFVVDDGVHGRELWTSDGTEDGTHLVRDVAPGRADGAPHRLAAYGDLLVFIADDGVHGAELWVSDGSAAGTAMVADVRAGAAGARIRSLVVAGGLVWFVANDGVHGSELWSTDGTPEGTSLVADLDPGAEGSLPADLVAFGDGVLFSADDGATGREPWRADAATGAVRVADLHPGPLGSEAKSIVVAGDRAYFAAAASDTSGAQLWATDGTEAGTFLVSGVKGRYGPLIELDLPLTAAIGDTLYFVTDMSDGRGLALWRTDGSEDGTRLVADLKSYPCSAEFRAMVAMGDRLLLVARSPESDDELWISDGTESGTSMVKDIFPGQAGSRPGSLAVAGGVLFFAAYDGLHGRELWRSDGSEEGTVLVRDVLDGATFHGVWPYGKLVAAGDDVLFAATDFTVWKSDGTAVGTSPLGPPAGLALTHVFDAGGGVAAAEGFELAGARRAGLWRYDGTVLDQAVDLGADEPRLDEVVAWQGDLLFTSIDLASGGGALWRSVPGTRTPQLLRSFSAWWPTLPTRVRDRVYFSAGDWATGSELWTTDGTVAGTVLVKDVGPGGRSGVYNGGFIGNLGRRVLFVANDGVHGAELWRTDGTSAGTELVRDIEPGIDWSWPLLGGRLGGVLLFAASDEAGYELWRTDGTTTGTYRVKDIAPGAASSTPFGFVRLGDVLLFAAEQPALGRELWRTDGTADGTWLVADVQPGLHHEGITPITVVGDVAYFPVQAAGRGSELWMTDGTAAGTRLAVDVATGSPTSGVGTTENRNGQLFFVADDGVHGTELWALTCGNGALDEREQCDDGAANGSPAGCCTGACTIRPGTGDACDPIEGSLAVHRARVQYDAPGGAVTGRISVDGHLDAGGALPFSLAAGLTAFVEDGAGLSQRIEWSAGDCAGGSGGVQRCARPGAVATFRPVAGAGAAMQRHRFAVSVRGVDVTGPLAPSLAVKLRTGDRLDRSGRIEDCVGRAGALVCRP